MLFIRAFFSKTVRQAKDLNDQVLKILNHQRDILPERNVLEVQQAIAGMNQVLASGADAAALKSQMTALEESANKWLKGYSYPGLRDWVDTIVVAGSVAIAFRTFFFQPMVIPTGSAQPTFNGITHVDYRQDASWKMPGVPKRIWDYCIYGITYHEAIARADGQWDGRLEIVPRIGIGPLKLNKQAVFRVGGEEYRVSAPDENAVLHLGLLETVEGQRMPKPLRYFKTGQPIVRCSVQTGDHLLVNRITYNFRRPHRGETIVFRSEEHPGMTRNTHYIKRLIALPNERVRIGDDRHVYINGRRLDTNDFGFENVYSFDPKLPPRADHYSGHLNGTIWAKHFGTPGPTGNFPDERTEITIRPGHYLTFGDNTLNSADSRDWPEPDFPEEQVVGKESFVFWPFSERWGSSRR